MEATIVMSLEDGSTLTISDITTSTGPCIMLALGTITRFAAMRCATLSPFEVQELIRALSTSIPAPTTAAVAGNEARKRARRKRETT